MEFDRWVIQEHVLACLRLVGLGIYLSESSDLVSLVMVEQGVTMGEGERGIMLVSGCICGTVCRYWPFEPLLSS